MRVEQLAEQEPEELVARVALDPAKLAPLVDQHEGGREYGPRGERDILGKVVDLRAAQGRAQRLVGLRIDRADLGVPALAPVTAVPLDHEQFRCARRGGQAREDQAEYEDAHGRSD